MKALSAAAATIVENFDGKCDIKFRDVMARCGMSENETVIALRELRECNVLRGEYLYNHFFHIDASRAS
jgi:alanine racemase